MNRNPWEKDPVLESITAKINDCKALIDGCSQYERNLRVLGPTFYQGDATFREIMIKLEVINHERNKPWWAR